MLRIPRPPGKDPRCRVLLRPNMRRRTRCPVPAQVALIDGQRRARLRQQGQGGNGEKNRESCHTS